MPQEQIEAMGGGAAGVVKAGDRHLRFAAVPVRCKIDARRLFNGLAHSTTESAFRRDLDLAESQSPRRVADKAIQ